jgi:hypothetical protein
MVTMVIVVFSIITVLVTAIHVFVDYRERSVGHWRRHCEEAKPTRQSSIRYWIATPLRGSR